MTRTIWVTWVTILVGQVGLIHKLSKLSGCDPDITCSLETVLASGKWVNFGSDECTEMSLVWNQLIISRCFEACGVQRFHLQAESVQGPVLYPAKNKEICGIVAYQRLFMLCYISLVNQALWSQSAYRLEIISTRSERVWWTAYTLFVQRIDRFCRLLNGLEVVHRSDDSPNIHNMVRLVMGWRGTPIITSVNHLNTN